VSLGFGLLSRGMILTDAQAACRGRTSGDGNARGDISWREQAMEARVISKVSRRIVPFVALCYFLCYLDRVNVGFAALQMNSDLGFTATMFGWGAGIFFFGYFFFEVPSNLALERFGARLWIARIMVTWGLLSAAMALIWNEASFLVVRFLLGAAEAGFFPGIILFLTYWFPAEYRARMVGRFMAAIPISTVIGAPVSGLILGMDGIWGSRAGNGCLSARASRRLCSVLS
jgi:ACS family tartrate transporter-like MFS transporter